MALLANLPTVVVAVGVGNEYASPWLSIPTAGIQIKLKINGSLWVDGTAITVYADLSEDGGTSWARYATAKIPKAGLIGGFGIALAGVAPATTNANRKGRAFIAVDSGSPITLVGTVET